MPTANVETTDPKIFRTLNNCIETCTDGEKGYASAAADVRDPALKAVFHAYGMQRAGFVLALQAAIGKLGGVPESEGTVKGAAHRGFMGVRMALEGRPDSALVGECERGERAALLAYDRGFKRTPLDTLPKDIRATLIEQRAAIKTAHDDILRRLAQH